MESKEQLGNMVKTGACDNYSERGMIVNGDPKAMDLLHKTYLASKLGLSGNREGFTRIAFVPLSSSFIPKELASKFDRKDFVVIISFHGVKVDSYSRDGDFNSIAVMSEKDANRFLDAVKGNPSLTYDLVHEVNGKPVTRFDGSPLDIKPGRAVEILPNTSVGGSITQATESSPFPPGFNPNPLF